MTSHFTTVPVQKSVLLHSLANFGEIFQSLLHAFRPATLCEIGIEHGTSAESLMQICDQMGIPYIGVDPSLTPEFMARHRHQDHHFHKEISHTYLAAAPPCECYFIDGDHNYFTVAGELDRIGQAVHRQGSKPPVIVLHDTWWPCGDRDFYYAIDQIPEAERHPVHPQNGPVPGEPGLFPWGFRGKGSFVVAEQEGIPRTGVNAAVKNWHAQNPNYQRLDLPAIFGVTILAQPDSGWPPSAKLWWDSMCNSLQQLGPLMARLEMNRVHLYTHVLQLDYQFERNAGEALEAEAHKQKAVALKAELKVKKEKIDQMKEELRMIKKSKAWRLFGRFFPKADTSAPHGKS